MRKAGFKAQRKRTNMRYSWPSSALSQGTQQLLHRCSKNPQGHVALSAHVCTQFAQRPTPGRSNAEHSHELQLATGNLTSQLGSCPSDHRESTHTSCKHHAGKSGWLSSKTKHCRSIKVTHKCFCGFGFTASQHRASDTQHKSKLPPPRNAGARSISSHP